MLKMYHDTPLAGRKKKVLLETVVSCVVLACIAVLVYRITVSMHYRWNWGVIAQYLFRYDPDQGRWVDNILVTGLWTTIRLSIWSSLLASVFGLFMGVMRTMDRLFFRLVSLSYVELIRNIPALVLVFIFYFFVSDQLMPMWGVDDFVRGRTADVQKWLAILVAPPAHFTSFVSGVITVALFQGAYIAEIVRAGIQSLEKGQWEASASLGLSWTQQIRHIILPQAARRVLPPLANEFINTIKYSSIVSVISIQELTFQGLQVMAATQATIEVWITISAMYFVLCFCASLAVHRLEKYMARGDT
ncbi:MAG: amino acid ABC transporter permease [Pseudomonadota bacterium]